MTSINVWESLPGRSAISREASATVSKSFEKRNRKCGKKRERDRRVKESERESERQRQSERE